jgi:HEAT repeat protein
MKRTFQLSAWAILLAGMFFLATGLDVFAAGKDAEAKKYTDILNNEKTPAKDRAEAIEKIGELANINKKLGEAALPKIKDALKDKDANVRGQAALAYGRCDPDDKDAVTSLIDMLKNDKEESVKVNAAKGLAVLGEKSKAALPALKEARDNAKKEKSKNEGVYRDALKTISGTKKK